MANYIDKKLKGNTVIVREGEHIDRALRKFKNKVADSKLLDDLREKQHYVKPAERRKKAKSAAKARWNKYLRDQQLPKKMY
jgi:small subunit ribosomal protein S21